jgi:tetratricopeptide (TPR) repeat protein
VIDERTLAAADRYLEMGRPEQALQALSALPPEQATAPHVRWLRAIAHVMQEDFPRAADEAREGLEDAPDDPDLLRVLSVAEEQQGHLHKAEEAILAALRESPDSAGLLCQYAELLMRGGQLEKAGHLIDAAAAIDPDAGDVLEARLRLSYLRADDKQARRHGEELLAHDPGSAIGQRMLGVLDFNQGHAGRAADRLGGVAGEYPSDYELGEAAREARAYNNPAWWPTRFFTRVGVWQSWIGVWVLLFALRAAGLQTVALVVLIVWFVLCAWSWIAPPILKRVQRLDV